VSKDRERLAMNKQRSHRFHTKVFNLREFNKVEGKENYHVEVSDRCAALEDLDTEVKINTAWEIENIKKKSAKERLSYYELKKHKPCFEEGCSELLNQRKEAKLELLQNLREVNGDNMNKTRQEFRGHFRSKRGSI
jgi:hypothetical protein